MSPATAPHLDEPHGSASQPAGALADAPEDLEAAYSGAHEQGADADHDRQPAAVAMNDQDLKPGDIVGDWKIDRFVAAGGMGEVYKVVGMFGGLDGALKRIRPLLSTRAEAEERFETEARILAVLKCPYIVRLLHAGRHSGRPYLVMEWLDGMTLRDFMNQRREPVELAHALHYAICIAVALCAAHEREVFHRDLKPENIFMLEKGTLKVLDFGLGKWAGTSRTSASGLGGMCTVHYAAPEQLEHTGVDDRTDVRALALIFVEMVTLRWAFAERPRELPAKEIARANQLLAEPPSLRSLLPDCPKDLAALIDAALSRDKTKRPHSDEFLAGLRAAHAAVRAPKLPIATDDEESLDAASQTSIPSEPTEETSVVRLIRQLRTETLPPNQPPADPTAAANPAPPPVRTVKMARPTDAELDAARAQEAEHAGRQQAARDEVADTTGSGSRAALLPALSPPPSAVSQTQAPAQLAAHAPARGPMPQRQAPPPEGHEDSAAARASLEFANRPTVPLQRTPPAQEATSSLSPTHQGVPPAAAPDRRRIPLWAAPLLGALLIVVPFMVGRAALSRPRKALPAAAASAPLAATASATAAFTSAPAVATASATAAPALSASAAALAAGAPAPSEAATTTATAAPPVTVPTPRTAVAIAAPTVAPHAPTGRANGAPRKAIATASGAPAKGAAPPGAGPTAAAVSTAHPQPSAEKPETPPAQPTAAPHRVFDTEN